MNLLRMIGNAHLDPAWMWQWGEGMEAFIATCRAALERMDETPGFIFTCSSAAHYRWIEEAEPEMFERIRERVWEGRWNITGGWWVQADCNLPSGEGFARQALLGQRYFLEKFGVIARTGYSPDAFGHNIGLPQLLAHAGMNGYIFCRPDPTELTLPSPLIRWIGPDGSEVLAYRVPFHYNMYESSVPKKVNDLLEAFNGASNLTAGDRPLRDFGDDWMLFYGVGNHGGGPTREHIAQIIAIDADPGAPSLLFSTPDDFFEQVRDATTIPEWRDDLQLNSPGCYSAHSGIKRLNRRSEHALMEAERIASLASLLTGLPYPSSELGRAWENVCFNHFHDILCGVAIREALDDATEMYGEALSIAKRASRLAVQRIARAIDTTGPGLTLIVFNQHSWDVASPVTFELWHDIDKKLWLLPVLLRMEDDDGKEIPCQLGFTSGKIGRDRIAVTFTAEVPALGWRCYRVFYGEPSQNDTVSETIHASDTTIENRFLRLEISPATGAIVSIVEKESGREMLAGEGALPVVIDDPTDTWGHGVERFDAIIGTFADADVRLVEHGPMYATIRARSRWGSSWIQHDYHLHRDSSNVHVDVRLFWGEERKMLKLRFPAAITDATAWYESAYAAIAKPCDGVERPGGSWAAIVGTSGGMTGGIGIVNDAKYGYSADVGGDQEGDGAALSMTVLRSPSHATHDPHPFDPAEDLDFIDQGMQRFRYAIIPIAHDGWRATLAREAMLLNEPLIPHLESAHNAAADAAAPTLERHYRGIEITPANVMATVVKRAEDGTGWIFRLFETGGIESEAAITFHPLGRSWHITLRPHQIATVRIDGDDVVYTTLFEG